MLYLRLYFPFVDWIIAFLEAECHNISIIKNLQRNPDSLLKSILELPETPLVHPQ